MIKTIGIIVLGLLFLTSPVYAAEPPILISPANNSTVTTSKLEWQAPSYPIYTQGSPYVVQIKNIPTFTPQDDRYKTNTYYTPKLSDGPWYWRVKAKNNDGIWSDWSTTWSFNLTTSTPTITPTPTPSPTSTAAPSSSSFIITNIPSEINSDQSFTTSVNLSLPDNPNTTFYLKGAFRHPDKPSNYFGLTKVGSSWVKNSVTATSQLQITTDTSGNWTSNIEVQPDSEDSGFTGTGDYIFKAGRYTSAGSGPTWSNESNIKIVSTESSDQGGTLTSTANTSSSTINPSTTPSSVKNKVITSPKPKSYDRLVYRSASVAAATASANPSPTIQVKNHQQPNLFPWIGVGLVIAGIGSLIFIYLRSRKFL